ncbi:hypothetical protein AC791_05240 [Klebsiella sp. RIT-PI-d]|uniref:DUF6708 domain-containing protein n=1 Tax=Klebsiella sp. RIT-PI-d TaxID=1681196 RepID=UPI000676A2BB|nr:DUF6708 domain-containing protein [Klebsiella sp. RIT-PI-d]KNC11338.1 hypothetical protein AC791_05240 [Klebsiella sp. RIT-PI-d]
MALKTSRLFPQVKYWDEDLPEPQEEQRVYPRLIRVNEINDVWMEIPRYVNHGWGGLWFYAIMLLVFFINSMLFLQLPGVFDRASIDMKIMLIFSNFFLLSFVVWCFRMVLFVPRGAPVRFNRKRQKVYVYEHQQHVWPWKRWPVTIKVLDWADIHGERVFVAGRGNYGHQLYCAVCKPGTYEVVDRFILNWTVGDIRMIYGLWSHCCQYMQGKAVSDRPLITEVPLSWTPFKTVRWPQDIERESTTSPE